MKRVHEFTCDVCGKHKRHEDDVSTGYGTIGNFKACFECCGKLDELQMVNDGKTVLYLSYDQEPRKYSYTGFIYPKNARLINWPGTLSIPIRVVKVGRHNIAGCRFDVWFKLHGQEWHGVQYGANTQICHCRRIKRR